MIYKQCVLTIVNNNATLDEDIYLYRLDKNVELYFTIVNNKYKFDKSDLNNIISITNASYFQMRLYKNEEVKYTFAIQPTDEGKAKLTITDDLIDEPIEVGDYDFQISLLDADKSSMVSMPIARQQLHVCEPLVDITNETGSAVLGLSQLDTTGEIVDAFDENGNYIRKVHVNGEIISAELFNKWETVLDTNTKNIAQVSSQYKDVANRLEILPIKNTHHIIQDGVPVSQQNINLDGTDYKVYLFNDEQITVPDNLVLGNFKNKFLALYYDSNKLVNAIVTYNDGKNNITKEVELTGNDYSSSEILSYTEESASKSLLIEFGFDNNTNKFYMYVNDYSYSDSSTIFYEVKNVSLSYSKITNLLDDDYLKSINYSKIEDIPYQLNALVNDSMKTLSIGEYSNLFDNLFIWDANKVNDKLDSASGVKQNQYYNHNIKIKQKDSEGIGYGQYIPSSVMTEYKLFVSAGSDVIIKVYNRKSKELITELSDCPSNGYQTITISDSYSGTDGIFIAFTVKDSVTNFYGNTYVNDLILCKPSTFLTKQDVNNKVDKSQLSFNSNGELVVTINGVSKTFVPKA